MVYGLSSGPSRRGMSGLELSWLHGTGGLEQRSPSTVSVSVLDVAHQPAGAFGAGMQRVPVHVLFRCTTVSGKGRGVVYAPHIFTLGMPSRARCLTSLQFPSGSAVPWGGTIAEAVSCARGKT